jgi:predicted DNA-binding transcriptional regulator YafY
MEGLEAKKLALLRILQIIHKYSDLQHPLTQEKIAYYLDSEYGIVIERKAISRNISLLMDADVEIGHCRDGYYLETREFEDTELKLLVDSVLCNQNITAKHSADLIEKLCKLSNKYFRSHVKNVYAVKDWNKSDNAALFFNIEMIDMAINEGKQVQYDYNKYGKDKKLHKSSFQRATPYQLILHNQRYYLMGYSEYWGNMIFHRLDRITNIKIYDAPAYPLKKVPGYESGIDYKKISTTMPYLHSDKPERVEMLAEAWVIDQVVDWFGKDLAVRETDDPEKIIISLWANPYAMSLWALQYVNYIEVISPEHLRNKIRDFLKTGFDKYSKQ